MAKKAVSLRIEPELKRRLEEVAKMEQRDTSFIMNKAINEYVDLYEWQINRIRESIDRANNKEFASKEEVKNLFKDYVSNDRLNKLFP
ncbi:putative CopG family transcriptional regulator [Candidatus Hepatincolaceae symbiont of Richtersius coronifer]